VAASAVIAVAMSGGVDSSVAAARVALRGYDTVGITLSLWPRTREILRDRGCCSVDSVDDARRVASTLRIRHYVWNLEQEFEDAVVREFEDEYAQGRTPNPCVRCNERVKFGALLQGARAIGATHVATGHYARRGRRGTAWTLHRARDMQKDQSYTLHRLDQEQLSCAVFPLGDVGAKREVRDEARALRLVTADKRESQDLCFLDGPIRQDLRRRLAGRFSEGPIVDTSGRELGRHQGLPFYTVGQRSGLGLAPDVPNAQPLRVLELRPATNAVVVGPREQLARRAITLLDSHWTSVAPQSGAHCDAQLRAHGDPRPATIVSHRGAVTSLRLDAAADNVSPGQSLVLYSGDEVLGGGVISAAV